MKEKMTTLTMATFDTNGIQPGDKITILGQWKPWYKRLFHFLTFGIFNKTEHIITEVNSSTELTIEE